MPTDFPLTPEEREALARIWDEASDGTGWYPGKSARVEYVVRRALSAVPRLASSADAAPDCPWCTGPVPDGDPVKPLGEFLGRVLDDDQFNHAERMLNDLRRLLSADAAPGAVAQEGRDPLDFVMTGQVDVAPRPGSPLAAIESYVRDEISTGKLAELLRVPIAALYGLRDAVQGPVAQEAAGEREAFRGMLERRFAEMTTTELGELSDALAGLEYSAREEGRDAASDPRGFTSDALAILSALSPAPAPTEGDPLARVERREP